MLLDLYALIEALRAKVPTILHNSPVYEELFSDVGIMVDGENHKEVGEKILEVYSNSEKYKSRVEKGYELSKKYTWDKVAERTYEVFEKVSEKKQQGTLNKI